MNYYRRKINNRPVSAESKFGLKEVTMNNKLYILLLTLTLAISPALHAMKRALVPIARSLRNSSYTKVPTDRPAYQAGQQVLARAQFTNTNERGHKQEEPRYPRGANYLPVTAIAIGLGLTAQHALEEQDDSFSIDKLDINDVKAVVEALKKCSKKQQGIITKAIVQNINNYSGYDLQRLLEASDKQNQEIITTAIALNINHNINNYDRYDVATILEVSAKQNQEIITIAIADDINKNFKKYDIYSLHDLLKASNQQNQELIVTAIAQNIDKFDSHNDHYGAYKLIEASYEQNQKIITTALANDINKNFNKYNIWSLCEWLKTTREQNQVIITSAIAQNINKYSAFNLRQILENFSGQNQEIITKAIMQNIDAFDSICLHVILKASSEKNQDIITKAIVQNIDRYSDLSNILTVSNEQNNAIINAAIRKKVDDFIGEHNLDSQSAAHLKNNITTAWEYIRMITNNSKYKAAFQQAMNHEQLISDTTAVFYHSQRSPVYWLELLYTKLWEQKYNQKSTNYLFTRFPDDVSEFSNALLQIDGQEKKSILLTKGRKRGQDELRPYLLFANYALFGNSTNWGSCSVHYFIKNFNVGDPSITTQAIMDKFGDNALFGKYKTELEQLEKEFKEIVPNSVLLQLAIPHNVLNNHIYLAAPGGYKKTLQISSEEIDDVTTIIKTLKTNPKALDQTDEQEFCIVMTPDTVHTLREQGAEIRVYGDFDQEKLNVLMGKLEALIAHIAKENPQTFSAKLTPTQSYQAYKHVLDELIKKHEKSSDMIPLFQILD